MSQQDQLRKHLQQQPSPGRLPRPSDVLQHGFGSPEGMELTDFPTSNEATTAQSSPQQTLQGAPTTSTESSSPSPPGPSAAGRRDETPPSAAATPVSPTAEVAITSQTSSPSGTEDTPSKPRKRRLFFTPSPRKTSGSASPGASSSPAALAAVSTRYTTPQHSEPRSQYTTPISAPSASSATQVSASGGPSRPSLGRVTTGRRNRPPLSTPLSGLSTTPRSSRQQTDRRTFNPLNRISDIFSPQSPSFSRSSPGLTPVGQESSSDDLSSASSDSSASSVKEPFTEQVERLNQLLATPAQQLGELGRTSGIVGEEDDDLDSEMSDLESSRQMLAQELSRVDFSFLGDLGPSSPGSPAFGGVDPSSPEGMGAAATPSKDDSGEVDTSGEDWIPLLPSEGSYEPNFSPAMGQQPSPKVSPPAAAKSSKVTSRKKSSPKISGSDVGIPKSGGKGMFGRFYTSINTPPREKQEDRRKPPPSSTPLDPSTITHDIAIAKEEGSKAVASTFPPKPIQASQVEAQQSPDRLPASSTNSLKTPDRLTTSSPAYSPFNPFGLETPSPRTELAVGEQPVDHNITPPSSFEQVSSIGTGGISEISHKTQPSVGESGNIFQSIASFGARLAEGSGGSQNEPAPELLGTRVGEMGDNSSRILEELDSILSPPIQRMDVESQQRPPAVTPGDRTPYFGRRLDETFDSVESDGTDRLTSLLGTESMDTPSDDQMSTPQQQGLPSMLDTRNSAQPSHRRLDDEIDTPVPRAFGQETFVTPPQGRSQLPSLVDETSTAKKQGAEAPGVGELKDNSPSTWGGLVTFSVLKNSGETSPTPTIHEAPTVNSTIEESVMPLVSHAHIQQNPDGGERVTLASGQEVAEERETQQGQGEEKELKTGTTLFPSQTMGNPMATPRHPSNEIEDRSPRTHSPIHSESIARSNDRLWRPPRPPILGSFPSFKRQSRDEVQADIKREKKQHSATTEGSTPMPSNAQKEEVTEEEAPFKGTVPRILTEDSDDEMIFDLETPNNDREEEEYGLSSPPEADPEEKALAESKSPMSCETDGTPGTIPVKSYSVETVEKAKEEDRKQGQEVSVWCRICVPFGIIIVVIGIALLIGYLIDVAPSFPLEPSSAPTMVPSLSPRPTSTPSSAPSPPAETSEAPTTSGTVSFITPYRIFIQNGLVSPVSESEYIPSLTTAMDFLTYDILANIGNGGNVQNLRKRKLIGVLLPTEVVEIINVTCPVVTGRDLCQRVLAQIALVDGEDNLNRFQATTELAIEIGRLQFHLDAIDPFCPAEVVDSTWELPAPSPFAQPTFPPLLVPSQSPFTNLSPSLVPSFSPVAATDSTSSSPSNTRETDTPSSAPTTFNLFAFLKENSFDDGIALTVPWSPQGRAYAWLVQDTRETNYPTQQILQRYIMATLYYATFGDNWLANDSWLSSESECTWFNKSRSSPVCNSNNELVSLQLDLNNLGGSLPAELGLLSNSLERITLRGGPSNFLSGTLPPELGYLTRLKVFFARGNNLSDTIPHEIGYWRELEQLDLSRNRFAGPLPTEIGNFRNLEFFEVSGNNLSGVLPSQMGLMTVCTQLFFEENTFLSSVPTEFGNLSLLKELKGGSNVLLSLPSELGQLTNANIISFTGSSIPGRIPSELGRLQGLRFLELRNNVFDGNIPSELGLLIQLRDQLDLSYNRLSGPIPSDLGRLVELRGLSLQHNLLTGQLPSEISQLSRLTSLQLEGNQLTGSIPDLVCNTFNSTYPHFSSDCAEFDDNCPCCTVCCTNGENCECRYLNTPREFLCYQQRGN
ncbi:two component regulator [Nitzschia inconspicua]|uniref:Two component regulator n=1 Tax=Nitzschia inconspicua TaxID=303405 RepID=A0A9K3KXD3_9STRA|nr:two component regulator [Nitzschia inconspicua]